MRRDRAGDAETRRERAVYLRRPRAAVLVAVVVLAGFSLMRWRAVRAQVPLVTTVSWTDPDGQTGSMQFQGTASGNLLNGIAYADGLEVKVRGTIASDGTVTGVLSGPGGRVVGTFSAQLDAQHALRGGYVVLNGRGGGWKAAAESLPVPGRRLGDGPSAGKH